MTAADPKSPLGSEFDSFLFALLGEDSNGLPLSVASLLARMNLDPWQEAGELAALPVDAAARRLTCSLDTLMDPVLRQANTEAMARRLLALLPRPVPVLLPRPHAVAGSVATSIPGTRIGVVLIITSAIVVLGSQFLAAHRHTSIPREMLHEPAALPAPSQTPPPDRTHKA